MVQSRKESGNKRADEFMTGQLTRAKRKRETEEKVNEREERVITESLDQSLSPRAPVQEEEEEEEKLVCGSS